ncbi:MAG: alpha/beta hydrolase, partial [bacterium]
YRAVLPVRFDVVPGIEILLSMSRTFRKKMINTILFPAILLAFVFLFVRLLENKLVFFPSKYPDGFWQPEQFGLHPRDVFFETEDGVRLHGWFFEKEDAIATLLLMHGNAGNLSHRVDLVERLLGALPVEIFIFDYRGYGKSAGAPTEEGVYRDADAAYKYLTQKLNRPPEKIILHGRSLGGAVAVDLATKVSAAGLLLESTFSSGNDMAKEMFKVLPLWWFTTIKMDSESKIRNVNMPILMLHGKNDSIVPFHLGKKLFEVAPQPKSFVEIPDAGHNDVYVVGGPKFYAVIKDFIAKAVLP